MALLRAQKVALVDELVEELKNSRVALLFSYSALDSQGNLTLRDKSYEQGGKIKMLSNNLLRLVLERLEFALDLPEKPLALAYQFADEINAAKTLVDFAKETEKLEVIAGWIDGRFFKAEEIKTLAALPGQEVLQSQLIGRLAGLLQRMVYGLNFPLQKFAFVIKAVEETRTKDK